MVSAFSFETKKAYSASSEIELMEIFRDNNLTYPKHKNIEGHEGVIFSETKEELMRKVYEYYTESLKEIQKELIKLNMQHDQDIINITDELNKISINI